MWSNAKDKNLGLTAEEVLRTFDYNPNNGLLRWKITRQKVIKGKIAGYVSKSDGYRYVCINQNDLLAHRIIWLMMTGKWPKCQIDHKNRVRDDNRWINLRESTNGQNTINQEVRKDNQLGAKGIWYDEKRNQYRVKIQVKGKSYTIGRYNTLEEAKEWRKLAEEEFYGEFAK
jgi:HNH endonuclease/AP2 domain